MSKENDNILMSFEHDDNLFLDLFEHLTRIDQQLINDSKTTKWKFKTGIK